MGLNEDFEKFKRNLAVKVEQGARVGELEAHAIVAQKTGDLDRSIRTLPARIEGNLVKATLEAQTDYAVFVHEGVRGEAFNYHRGTPPNREVVYTGVGQKFFDRALARKEDEIVSIIRSAKI